MLPLHYTYGGANANSQRLGDLPKFERLVATPGGAPSRVGSRRGALTSTSVTPSSSFLKCFLTCTSYNNLEKRLHTSSINAKFVSKRFRCKFSYKGCNFQ